MWFKNIFGSKEKGFEDLEVKDEDLEAEEADYWFW